MYNLPGEVHCQPTGCRGLFLCTAADSVDPSQLWLWIVSRDVASLSYSSVDVPERLLAQVKALYHLKISLRVLSLVTDPLDSLS